MKKILLLSFGIILMTMNSCQKEESHPQVVITPVSLEQFINEVGEFHLSPRSRADDPLVNLVFSFYGPDGKPAKVTPRLTLDETLQQLKAGDKVTLTDISKDSTSGSIFRLQVGKTNERPTNVRIAKALVDEIARLWGYNDGYSYVY